MRRPRTEPNHSATLRSVSSVVRALKPRSMSSGSFSGSPCCRMSRVRLYSLVLLAVAESSLRPIVLSTAASSSRLLLVNSWLALLAPGGVHDGHQIVGAETALDELLGGRLDARRCGRSACAGRRRPSRRRGRRTASRWSCTSGSIGCAANSGRLSLVDRNVDQREVGDRLRLPVLEHLEVFLLQVADEVALTVGDDGVDLDVVDADLEGRRLLAGGWRRRAAAAAARGPGRPSAPRRQAARAARSVEDVQFMVTSLARVARRDAQNAGKQA